MLRVPGFIFSSRSEDFREGNLKAAWIRKLEFSAASRLPGFGRSGVRGFAHKPIMLALILGEDTDLLCERGAQAIDCLDERGIAALESRVASLQGIEELVRDTQRVPDKYADQRRLDQQCDVRCRIHRLFALGQAIRALIGDRG